MSFSVYILASCFEFEYSKKLDKTKAVKHVYKQDTNDGYYASDPIKSQPLVSGQLWKPRDLDEF